MEKETEIINAARKLFTKYGYKKVSMDEIASEAGVTKKTVYSHFKDKDSLFEYFVNEELSNMKKIYDKNENKTDDFTQNFHEIIYQLIKYKKESEFLNLIAEEAETLKTKSMINFSKKVDESIQNFIKEKLINLINNNLIKDIDVDLCTFTIYTLYLSIMFKYPKDDLDEKTISDTLTKILKDGLFN
jgi:AcrR family transcriptional regulator